MCALLPHLIPALAPGAMVAGRYRVEGPLGSGGFGTVVRATQLPLGREVAIKIMSSPLGDSARFIQEAHTAQKLEHPNTVRILDFGELEGGLPFIVFELLRGENLAEFIARSGALPVWAALKITSQILKSLMEAHSHGVVHRDIKPGNIFVTAHPGEPIFVKVLDFGVAKQMVPSAPPRDRATPVDRGAWATGSSSPAATRADQIVGTPLYMSPEQARAQPVGPQSDLYSVGLVLAEMFTGRSVLDPTLGAVNVALLHANSEALPLPAALSDSPVEAIVRRATAKEASLRYRSASEMLSHVEHALAFTSVGSLSGALVGAAAPGVAAVFAPTLVAPFTPRLESNPPARKPRRWLVVAFGFAAALALVSGLALAWQFSGAPPSGPAADFEEESSDDEVSFKPKPFRTLDLSTRQVPSRTADEMMATLRDRGYTVAQSAASMRNEHMDQTVLNLRKRPCGGAVIYTVFQNADLQRTYVATMRTESILVETDNRVLCVFLDSALQGPDDKKHCSHPALAILTHPKPR